MRSSIRHPIRIHALAALAAIAPALTAAQSFDRPLKIIQTTEVRLTDTVNPGVPTKGEARFLVLVDDRGALIDLLLTGSTHRSFTQAAVSALQEWQFEPAWMQGQAVWTRNTVRLHFDARGRIVSITGADVLANLVSRPFEKEFTNRLASESELDAPLQPSATVRPKFPAQLSGQLGERSAVLLDFYIDETGRPRMPVARRSAHPFLTEAAMDALDQWRFAPPTRDRRPVIVHALQEFVFIDNQGSETVASATSGSTL